MCRLVSCHCHPFDVKMSLIEIVPKTQLLMNVVLRRRKQQMQMWQHILRCYVVPTLLCEIPNFKCKSLSFSKGKSVEIKGFLSTQMNAVWLEIKKFLSSKPEQRTLLCTVYAKSQRSSTKLTLWKIAKILLKICHFIGKICTF